MAYRTEQEAFWAGGFGDDYIDRNRGSGWVATNAALFARVLSRTRGVSSVLELGASIGLNLHAIRLLLPAAEVGAVEINERAAVELRRAGSIDVYHQSILDFEPSRTWDLVFTKGVLIHVDPAWLGKVYDVMHAAAGRYILVCEYYNPTPTEVAYRGHHGKLFKRDFAGELLDRHNDLALVDYGFVYHRDTNFQQDDITWFLLERK